MKAKEMEQSSPSLPSDKTATSSSGQTDVKKEKSKRETEKPNGLMQIEKKRKIEPSTSGA